METTIKVNALFSAQRAVVIQGPRSAAQVFTGLLMDLSGSLKSIEFEGRILRDGHWVGRKYKQSNCLLEFNGGESNVITIDELEFPIKVLGGAALRGTGELSLETLDMSGDDEQIFEDITDDLIDAMAWICWMVGDVVQLPSVFKCDNGYHVKINNRTDLIIPLMPVPLV
jgi:hypothetical protein